MKLPNVENVIVSERKLTEYLLSTEHPHGKSKARFFLDFGFDVTNWEAMAESLKLHALTNEVTHVEDSPFGKRYVIEGVLETPSGTQVNIRAAWFIETGEEIPHFVTAVPLKRLREK